MALAELLDEELILFKKQCSSKEELLEGMVDKLVQTGKINDKGKLLKIIIDRERASSTGVCRGIAIPHGRTEVVDEVVIVFARIDEGVDFGALDHKPVYLVFLLVTPEEDTASYLAALAQISRFSRKKPFRERLMGCQTPAEIIQTFRDEK